MNTTLLDALPFLASGFRRIEPAVLHPASIFLEMSGEEVCLRPEYTIPVCRSYPASEKAWAVAEYAYLGPCPGEGSRRRREARSVGAARPRQGGRRGALAGLSVIDT